jgi:hypothetical protein
MIVDFVRRIFGSSASHPDAFDRAMTVSGELLMKMQNYSRSTDAPRAIMADVWAHNHNIPFITTVLESVQEAKSGIEQKPTDL